MVLELLPLDDDTADEDERPRTKSGKPRYEGVERRREHRRQGRDRRAMVRFELDNEDRRSGDDRREEFAGWKNIYSI